MVLLYFSVNNNYNIYNHKNSYFLRIRDVCFMLIIVMYTYFWSYHLICIPSLFSYTHTLFTCLILIFIFLIMSSHYHYTSSHFSLYHTNTTISPTTSLTSYYSTRYHNTSQLTHHHINTMTISHSPADDGRKNSSESSCYIYIYCYFYMFTQLYKSLEYRVEKSLALQRHIPN